MKGQEPHGIDLFEKALSTETEICIPEICAFEAMCKFENERKTFHRRRDEIDRKVRAAMSEPHAEAVGSEGVVQALESEKLAYEKQLNIWQARLEELLTRMDQVRLLNYTAAQIRDTPVGEIGEMSDDAILRVVLDDAAASPVEKMAFYTRNTKDFRLADVLQELEARNVELITTSSHAMHWTSS